MKCLVTGVDFAIFARSCDQEIKFCTNACSSWSVFHLFSAQFHKLKTHVLFQSYPP
jgi:hypothetical protein